MRDNVGEEVDAEQLIQEACRSCLEQVRPRGADRMRHYVSKKSALSPVELGARQEDLPKKSSGQLLTHGKEK